MSAVITPASAPAPLVGAAPELVLQPGAVVDARVLAVRENIARIAIAGFAIEVLTEVALQPGANLKLAVSQTAEGNVRLAVVPRDTPVQGQTGVSPPAVSNAATASSAATGIGAATQTILPKVASAETLVPASPEALAISQAVQAAAPRQASLSPLFANLPVIVASDNVPQQVQSAASRLLATRPLLDSTLTADDLRQAFQKSGLFLEANLARGAAPAGAPDLKAALVVFRQVLSNWLGQPGPAAQISAAAAAQPRAQSLPQNLMQAVAPPTTNAPALPNAPGLAPANADAVRAQVLVGAAEAAAGAVTDTPASIPQQRVARVLAELSGEAVRTTVQNFTRDATGLLRGEPLQTDADQSGRAYAQPAGHLMVRSLADPAPPFRGAALSPQPIAQPTLAPDISPSGMGQQLLDQTDAALARQTLLQVASLPDRPEFTGTNQSTQTNQPRWSFEIPFATPQGTAVAQFEISRDGGNEVEAAAPSRVWRARFTLDVEPTGPVHALVSLIGDKTAVRMWAERPETVARLRANTEALGQALRQAELEPGDILIGEGAPPQPVKPRAGRFLDRAT